MSSKTIPFITNTKARVKFDFIILFASPTYNKQKKKMLMFEDFPWLKKTIKETRDQTPFQKIKNSNICEFFFIIKLRQYQIKK